MLAVRTLPGLVLRRTLKDLNEMFVSAAQIEHSLFACIVDECDVKMTRILSNCINYYFFMLSLRFKLQLN